MRLLKNIAIALGYAVLLVGWLAIAVFLVEVLYYVSTNWAGGVMWRN